MSLLVALISSYALGCGGTVAGSNNDAGPAADGAAPVRPCDMTCDAVRISSGPGAASIRTSDAAVFYFRSSEPPALIRREVRRTSESPLAETRSALETPYSLSLAGNYAFWLAGADSQVFRVTTGFGSAVTGLPVRGARAIAASQARIYVGFEYSIDSYSIDGSEREIISMEIDRLIDLDAVAGRLIWLQHGIADSARLRVSRPSDHYVTDISSSLRLPVPFSFDGSETIWATREAGQWAIYSSGTESQPQKKLSTFGEEVVAVRHDATGVVAFTRGGRLMNVRPGPMRMLTPGVLPLPREANSVRLTATDVVWMSEDGLWRAPRDCAC